MNASMGGATSLSHLPCWHSFIHWISLLSNACYSCHNSVMRAHILQTILAGLLCLTLLAACEGATTTAPSPTRTATAAPTIQATTPAPTATPTAVTPRSYTARTLLRSAWRPDDLAFDPQGRVLFSDVHNGIIGRLNSNGSVTVLL